MSERRGRLRRLDQTGIPLLVARLVMGGLFIWMGLVKGLDPVDFMKLIREYQMVPDEAWRLLNLMAAVLPWVEVLCGVLLVTGVALRGTAFMILLMLTGFTIVVTMRAIGIYTAKDIAFCAIKFDCGCGAGVVYICHKIPENIGLLLMSLVVLLSRSRRFCLRPEVIPLGRGLQPAAVPAIAESAELLKASAGHKSDGTERFRRE